MKIRLVLMVIAATLLIGIVAFTAQVLVTDPSIIGNALVSTKLVIVEKAANACNISFVPGWNLVSFNCLSSSTSYDGFFENTTKHILRTYVADDSADPWKSNNPDLPSWVVHDLATVGRENGYYLYSSNDSKLLRYGELVVPTLIPVVPGWNLIGYPSNATKEINQTFGGNIPDFDYVQSYNASDTIDPWKEWTWNSSLASNEDLNLTVPGFGYWVYMLSSEDVVVS
ncbi:MAG: hypothetical protein ABIJ34_04510 [archaeon]